MLPRWDRYCIIEVEERMMKTRVIPSTCNPEWDEEFSIYIRNLRSNVSIKVKDKHADRDFNLVGVAEFRLLDVMLRSGW